MPDGRLYRFTPDNYPDLTAGLLEVCVVADDGSVSWLEVPDPSAAETATRLQVPDSTDFVGGEGIWYFDDWIFFSTKYDNIIHGIDLANLTYTRLYEAIPDDVADGTAVLSGVDNLTVDAGIGRHLRGRGRRQHGGRHHHTRWRGRTVRPNRRSGRLRDHRSRLQPRSRPAVLLEPAGSLAAQIVDINPQMASEEMFGGITYEITGPFRGIVEAPAGDDDHHRSDGRRHHHDGRVHDGDDHHAVADDDAGAGEWRIREPTKTPTPAS